MSKLPKKDLIIKERVANLLTQLGNKNWAVLFLHKDREPTEGDTITFGNMEATWTAKPTSNK